MKIVVICGSYMPDYSAVGICAKNIVDEFVKQGYDVTVIAERTASPIMETHAEEIRHITTPLLELYFSKHRFVRLLYRMIRYLQAIFSFENIKKDIVVSYIKELKDTNNVKKIDLIVPLCFPFEALLAANRFAVGAKTRVTPVIFDNFINNDRLHRLKWNRVVKTKIHLKSLKKILAESAKVFVIHSQLQFFKHEFKEETHKLMFIEHPLLLPPDREQKTSTTVFYAGSFLKRYVPSGGMAKILESVIPQIQNHFEFCVMGNDLTPIRMLESKFPDKIFNNGRVPFKEVMEKMANAGFLISVAELEGIQISSKIFTYISTGKPIIHFYYVNNDINLHILEKYPLLCAINLKEEDKNKLKDKLVAFLKAKHEIMDFDKIQTLFSEASPKFVVDNIISCL
ncbi:MULTISPECIES: glycosyltransferase family protein [Butyricimonas]|uniref:hypothetical protein n=1 Tax=Butyricimonas TaxID=574697 RepID=UPI0007FB4E56|nr:MULTISPECIES: hypothetical protein [Butyricimonas]